MTTTIYGIKNCDTMKKAFRWLEENKIDYVFHDYKKSGADMDVLKKAIADYGWDNVLNRKGTSWRALPDDVKDSANDAAAMTLARDNPSLVRRPLMVHGGKIYLGFDAESYKSVFASRTNK